MSVHHPVLLAALMSLLLFGGNAAAFELKGMFGGGGDDSRSIDVGKIFSSATKAFSDIDEEEEREIGREAAAVLVGASGLMQDKPSLEYLNQVGRWVVEQSKRDELKWRFGILDSDDINAFAAPGGYIFVTRGLLMMLQDESELAGVIAHEVTHVEAKHYLKAVKRDAKIDLASALAGAATDDRGDRRNLDMLAGGFKDVYAKGLDKEDEFEADRNGVVLAARAGYDPFGLVSVLQSLAVRSADDSQLALLFKTHPSPGDRLAKLDHHFDALAELDDGARGAERYQRFLAHLQKVSAAEAEQAADTN